MTKPHSESLLSGLAYLGGSRAAAIIMNLVSTSWLAYALGVTSYGINTFALAFLSYFQLLVGLGYDSYLVREVAHDPSRLRGLVESAVSVRLLLAALTTAILVVVVVAVRVPALTAAVILIQSPGLFSAALGLTSIYQGLQRMRMVAMREALSSLLAMGGMLAFVRDPADVTVAAAVLTASSFLMNGLIFFAYAREFGAPRIRLPRRSDLVEVRASLAFFWSMLMVTITYSFHIVLLGLFRSEAEVGLFGAGWKLFVFAIVVPNLISTLFMPRIARGASGMEAREASSRLYMETILFCAVPITCLGAALAPQILRLLFGPAFTEASLITMILMGNALVVSLNIGFGTPLLAVGRQKDFLYVVAWGAAAGAILNLVCVPVFGIEGAAFGTFANEIIILVLFAVRRPEIALGWVGMRLARCLLAIAPAAGVAVWIMARLLPEGHDLAAIGIAGAAGGVVYVAVLQTLGVDVRHILTRLRQVV